jgi:hypothetical protein
VSHGRPLKPVDQVNRGGVVGRQQRRGQTAKDKSGKQQNANDSERLVPNAPAEALHFGCGENKH